MTDEIECALLPIIGNRKNSDKFDIHLSKYC